VFWGGCKLRTSSGAFVAGVLYRELKLVGEMKKDGKKEHGHADMGADIYAVPLTHWAKNARFYGNVSSVEEKRAGGILPKPAGAGTKD